jgi:MFS family permease
MNPIVKRNVIACYISDIVLGTYFQLPIWIVYQSRFLSFGQIAFFSGLALIVEVVTQLPTGTFADIFGRKYALSLGNLFMALPMFLIALYLTPLIMPLYACMWGLGRAFCMGTSKPILYETLAKYDQTGMYSKILSRSVVCFQLSAAISILAGGYLYQYSPNWPYLVSGITSLVGVGTAFLFIEPRIVGSTSRLAQFVTTAKLGFKEIFKNSFVTKLTIMYALVVGIAQASQQFFMQPFMLELGMSDLARSWTAMFIKIAIAVLGAKLVSLTKVINHRYYLLIIPALMVISLIPAGVSTFPWTFLIFVGIAFNSGNSDLFISPEIHKHLSYSVRSTAISLQRMLASTFGAIVQWTSVAVVVNHSVGTYYSYLGIFSLLIILPLAYILADHRHQLNISIVENLESQLKSS